MSKERSHKLYDLKFAIESEEFQEYFMKPLYKEIDTLKASYSCDSLKELYRLKGKKEGLDFLITRLKQFEEDYQSLKDEIEAS